MLLPLTLFAQQFSVSGSVYDEFNQPIAYSNVVLMAQKDSVIVAGASTNELGFFIIENLKKDDYKLMASFIGFSPHKDTIRLDKDTVLKTITLKEALENLSEVQILVKKPTLQKEADRLIFNVANTALSEGSIMEVLRSTPGVLIFDNKISIKSTTPTVFINDKKVHLSSDELNQLLENSPASSIKSVEVITNPPAKYDAESGAVLNIAMSKNLITGYSGSIFSNYTQGVFPRFNAGTTNFYKTEKINVFANYSFTQSKINKNNVEAINFLNSSNNIEEIWDSDLDRNQWSKNHNFNFNLDYFIDDRSTLSISSNILFTPYFKRFTKGETAISDSSFSLTERFESENLSRDDKHNLGFDLDYVHSFKNEAKLMTNAHITTYNYKRDQDVKSDYFLSDNSFDFSTAFNTNSNQRTNIFTGQLDYELPFNETATFSVGAKTSHINTESDITQFDVVNGTNVLNTNNTDVFNYDESIYAAYLSYDEKWKKWSLSTGLRFEQTNIEGLSIVSNQKNDQDYFEWFPTINLSYMISEKVNVYTNYKRSVVRPDYQSLNPFRFFLNDNIISTGNPNLKPSFLNHVVIGTSISNSYIIEAYYQKNESSFLELPIQNNIENQLIYTPTNLSNTIEYGFDFSAFFNISDNWFVYFVTSFYNSEDKAMFNNESIKTNTWSNYSVLSNDLSLLKDESLTANFTLIYNGKNQLGFQINDTRIHTDLSIKKSIFKKKGNLSLHFADLLNKQDEEITSKYLDQYNSRHVNLDNRYIKLGFSYKFGNTILKTNERIKDRQERDRLKERQ